MKRAGRKLILSARPNFTITMLHTTLPPEYATFEVPLNMNKLDLRDYLYHAYNVRVHRITSRTIPNAVTKEGPPDRDRPIPRLYRPLPTKKMTVHLETPFKWPEPQSEEILDTDFDRATFRRAKEEGEKRQDKQRKRDTFVDYDDRQAMSVQARMLLKGLDRWSPPTRQQGNFAVRKASEEA